MSPIVRFGPYGIDVAAGQLRKHGTRIALREKSFQILAALLERPGEVVTRDELRRRLWPEEVFVDFDNNLNTAVARLREALGDSADRPRYIETLPKRGYRFLAKVSEAVPPPALPVRPRLLVLPFVNLSGDPAQEYFNDAMTDEIITALAAIAPEQLAVIARTTAMHYKGSHKDVGQIGRELNVDYIVEGGVRCRTDHVTLNLQLVQASDQTHLFARKYEATLGDIFQMQNHVAQTIAAHIPVIAGRAGAGARGSRRTAGDVAAYAEYIQGRYHAAYNDYIQGRFQMGKGTPEAFAAAKQHLERAIARDPDFAPPYDALAELHWYFGYFGLISPRDAFSAGIVHALRAIEIDNTRAETHALLGQFHKTVEYNWPEVHREMILALQLDPNSPLVRMRYAVSDLMPHGRLEEAVAELERALELDPLSLLARFWLGIVLLLWRRAERGLEEGRKLLDLDPTHPGGHFVLGAGYRLRGMCEEAVAAHRRAVELSGGSAGMLGWLGMTLAGNGRMAEARDVLQQLQRMAAKGYVPPCSFALVHLGLREIDTAFEWLERAVQDCDQLMMPIKSYAFFDSIRGHPRFTALLRKMNLEEQMINGRGSVANAQATGH